MFIRISQRWACNIHHNCEHNPCPANVCDLRPEQERYTLPFVISWSCLLREPPVLVFMIIMMSCKCAYAFLTIKPHRQSSGLFVVREQPEFQWLTDLLIYDLIIIVWSVFPSVDCNPHRCLQPAFIPSMDGMFGQSHWKCQRQAVHPDRMVRINFIF